MRSVRAAATAVVLVAGLSGMTSAQTARGRGAAGAPPDFSGTWTYDQAATAAEAAAVNVQPGPIFGDSFSVTQTAARIALDISVGGIKVTAAYNLDGTASVNMSPPNTPGGQPIAVTSHAHWDGARLVVESTSQSAGDGPGGLITVTSTRNIYLDDKGRLFIDRAGSPALVVVPSRSVYTRQK